MLCRACSGAGCQPRLQASRTDTERRREVRRRACCTDTESRRQAPSIRGLTEARARPAPPPITPQQVLSHVTRTVDWYRGLGNVEQLEGTPQDLLARDRLHDQSLTAVRLAFEFGRACASILKPAPRAPVRANAPPAAGGFAGQLDQISDRVAQRIAALQAQLSGLDGQLAKARGEQKATLSAQRGNVQAALALLKEVQGSMQDMQRFESYTLQGDNGRQSGLAGQIADLEKSVPEAGAGTTAPGAVRRSGQEQHCRREQRRIRFEERNRLLCRPPQLSSIPNRPAFWP